MKFIFHLLVDRFPLVKMDGVLGVVKTSAVSSARNRRHFVSTQRQAEIKYFYEQTVNVNDEGHFAAVDANGQEHKFQLGKFTPLDEDDLL